MLYCKLIVFTVFSHFTLSEVKLLRVELYKYLNWHWEPTGVGKADVNDKMHCAYELKEMKTALFQPLYSKRHVSFSHLHPDHYNRWKKPWLRKSNEKKSLHFGIGRYARFSHRSLHRPCNKYTHPLCRALETIWFFTFFLFSVKANAILSTWIWCTSNKNHTTESQSAHAGWVRFLEYLQETRIRRIKS